jgi:hypothetical protein
MDELRISKGVARWTADFTPPTEEYTSDTIDKTAAETINFADWVDLYPPSEVIADGFSFTESLPLPIDPSANEETLAFTDFASGGFQYPEELDDTLAFYDWVDMGPKVFEVIADVLHIVDVITFTYDQETLIDEEFIIWDTPKVGWNKSITDAITLVDSALVKHGISIVEWLILKETLLENWDGTESITDEINIADLIDAVKTITLAIVDTLTVVEAIPVLLAIKVIEYIFLHESVPLTDMFNVLDGFTLSDELQKSWDKAVEEAIALSDASMLEFLAAILNISDAINLADSPVGLLTVSMTASDAVSFADVVAAKGNIFSLILESLEFGLTLTLGGEVWQCWVISNVDFDPSVFSGFNFNSYCSFQNKAYGVKTDGLYILEGSTDSGAQIHAGIVLTSTNFSTENRKKFRRASLGISGSTAAIRVQTDEGEDRIFRVTDRRAYIDRDMVGKDFVFSVSDFDALDFMELVPFILAR